LVPGMRRATSPRILEDIRAYPTSAPTFASAPKAGKTHHPGRTDVEFGPRGRNVVMEEPLALCVFLEKFDGIADGEDRLGGIVGNFAPEFFLECHHEFDGVEAVGAEIVDEACRLGHLLGLDAEVFNDDLFDPVGNFTHRFHPRIFL
jgi:hypothetical protein